MAETVEDQDLQIDQEDSKYSQLKVHFNFPPIKVMGPQQEQEWVFAFDDSNTLLTIVELKKQLFGKDDYFLAVVLLEDPCGKKIYRPHRFVMNVLKQPPSWLQSDFRTALITALHRVQSEMEVRLRQAFFRQSDPSVSYSRVTDKRGQTLAMTHISHFQK